MISLTRQQQGFTLLELLIATTVFSVILLLITVGIINIGKSYYRGANQSRTQTVARNITDEISRDIQFSGSKVFPGGGAQSGQNYYFCANGTTYAFVIDRQLGTDVSQALIAQDGAPCDSAHGIVSSASGRELLTKGMRLLAFNVQATNPAAHLFTITLSVGFGGDTGDLLNYQPSYPFDISSTTCKSSVGQQFCALSKLTTTIEQRVPTP